MRPVTAGGRPRQVRIKRFFMEFFLIISTVFFFLDPGAMSYMGRMQAPTAAYVSIGIAAGVYIAMYVLRAIGLLKMAKNAGKSDLAWCAFVPVATSYLVGELAGDMRFGKSVIKKCGIYLAAAEFLLTVSLALQYIPTLYGYIVDKIYLVPSESGIIYTVGHEITWVADVANIGYTLANIFQWIYVIVAVFVYIAFFKRYVPGGYFMLGLCNVLMVWLPALVLVPQIAIFAVRNREAIDFDAYMRARMEEMQRRRQPYGGMQGGMPGAQPQPPRSPDDPFGDFPDPRGGGDPFAGSGTQQNGDGKNDGGDQG